MGFKIPKNIIDLLPHYARQEVSGMLEDKEKVKDLLLILNAFEKSIKTAANDSKTEQSLKDAFNTAATTFPLTKKVLENKGKIPYLGAVKLLPHVPKYMTLVPTINTHFKENNPALMGVLQSLVKDPAAVEALERILPKILPQEIQTLLQDGSIESDLASICGELQNTLENSGKTMKDVELKNAFTNVSTVLSVVKTYLETKKLPVDKALQIIIDLPSYQKSFDALSKAFASKDPALFNIAESLKQNENIVKSLKSIVPKAYGKHFVLDVDQEGKPVATASIMGQSFKFPLRSEDYQEIQEVLNQIGIKTPDIKITAKLKITKKTTRKNGPKPS